MNDRVARSAADVEDRWTLRAADRALLGNKTGATRLGFAVLLKLFQAEGRFPRRPEDVPAAPVEALASQVGVPAAAWEGYDWRGRTVEYHRAQLRAALGFREATLDDADALGRWLDGQVLALERRPDRLTAARERCRSQHLEPPSPERLERLVRSVLHRHEETFSTALLARLPPGTAAALDALIRAPQPGEAGLEGEEDRRVEIELVDDLKRVSGKPGLLFKLAAASLAQPDATVRDVIFPAVGEQTLHDPVAEGATTGPAYRRHLQTVIHNSYRSHYRRMLPLVLDALAFCSGNQAHRPVLDALGVIGRHAARKMRCYPPGEKMPLDGVVPADWRDAVLEPDAKGRPQVNRVAYEICVLQALREQLRCVEPRGSPDKDVWVEGADRYRNPDQDLPADFEARRDEHYAALGLPRDHRAFMEKVRAGMTDALATLDQGLAANPYVRILKHGGGRISVTPLERQPEPAGLVALKAEIARRWPMTGTLDMLKETDLRIGSPARSAP